MKILLLSDIHANICALHAIEQAETWDEVWCCGDLVDFGAYPLEVIRWMQAQNARCVLGNHDAYVLSLTQEDCRRAWDDHRWHWCHHNRERLDDDALTYLHSLPRMRLLTADGIAYQMQHQYDSGYGIVESLDQFEGFWKGERALQRRMLFGHTHRRCVHQLDECTLWCNPGSASYRRPDDPDKRAHYMVIEDGLIRFGAIGYDRSPLLAETHECLYTGRMVDACLQDAFFFFGNAKTTRDPLPIVNNVSFSS